MARQGGRYEEMRARNAARKCGLRLRKMGRNGSGYQIINRSNEVVAGENFDLSEDDVIQFCEHVYDPDAM
jgi:hypothetical protein